MSISKKYFHRFSKTKFTISAILSVFSFLLVATVAFAGVSGSAGPTYPTSLNVGDTNIPVSLQITNNSTSPQDAETVLVTNIFHTPSCGSDTSSVCQSADVDPGVFAITGAVTGQAGTACAANTFTVSAPDVTTGEVQFTPNTAIVLGSSAADGLAAKCIINFHVNVLKVPTKDSAVAAGIQTAQLARVHFTAQTTLVDGSASGSSMLTIAKVSPTIATVPSSGGNIGTVLNDTATLSGGSSPTGNVVFTLYAPTDTTCVAAPVYTDTDTTSPYATTGGYTSLVSGIYHWKAAYAGDANNNAVTSPCSDEPVTIVAPKGHIIVDKVTVPTASTQSFAFTTTGAGYTGFSLTDQAIPNDQTLDAGSYSVTETPVSGWTQTSAVCTDGQTSINPTSITLIAGHTVNCVFTNTLQSGHLIVQKTTIPGSDPTIFTINASGTGTITGGGAGTVTDAKDMDYTVTAGTYTVIETVPNGWTQTSNSCTGVVVGAGETKTCTMVNTQVVQYCSPGYWKQSQHFGSYVTYSPTTLFGSVFDNAFPGMTLLQVLQQGGGGINMLGRATVGALLNSTSMNSGMTATQVISAFNAAYPGTNSSYETTAALFTAPENCPLGNNSVVTTTPTMSSTTSDSTTSTQQTSAEEKQSASINSDTSTKVITKDTYTMIIDADSKDSISSENLPIITTKILPTQASKNKSL